MNQNPEYSQSSEQNNVWKDFTQILLVFVILLIFDIKEQSLRLVTFETFDQSDEKTWPDPKKPTHLPTYLPTYVPLLENTLKERSLGLVTF